MIPSSQLTVCAGPKATPAEAPAAAAIGDRLKVSTLPAVDGSGRLPQIAALLCSMRSYARAMVPPLVGSPWVAYHCRSTPVLGTPVQLAVKVLPPSPVRSQPSWNFSGVGSR